jgi:YhcH/YjgK/YiaL family protein
MIAVKLERAERQVPRLAGLARALEFLRRPDLASLPDGKYEIDGERAYAMVQRYETAAAAAPVFEAHRRYADVQYLAAGAETIAVAPLERLEVTGPYDGQKDACFGRVEERYVSRLALNAGELAVLYPEDAHAPRLPCGAPGQVVKVVIKVETT